MVKRAWSAKGLVQPWSLDPRKYISGEMPITSLGVPRLDSTNVMNEANSS